MLLIMIFLFDAEVGWGPRSSFDRLRGGGERNLITKRSRHTQQCMSASSTSCSALSQKSACSLCEACGQVGFERCLTGETSVREKVDEPHVVNAIVYLREPLLREEEGRTGEGGGSVDRGL